MTPLGRIDVHSHLLPAVDDGCPTLEESIACARSLVEAGYSHSFCTPHIWPDLPHNNVRTIAGRTTRLQTAMDEAKVPLQLLPGAELNLRADLIYTHPEEIPTFGMARRYCLFDIWADKLPAFFWKTVRWLQSLDLTVIMAHPERTRAVQDRPELAGEFADAGLLLQGNLQCFADPAHTHTRRTADRFLAEGRYFVLGSDCHNLTGMRIRLQGLRNAIQLAGEQQIRRLTIENPARLLHA